MSELLLLPHLRNADWPDPWVSISDPTGPPIYSDAAKNSNGALHLSVELHREICAQHPLHGCYCEAVAQSRDDADEYLFLTNHSELAIAFVHLTGQAESDPQWPYTVGYQTWEAFLAAWS